MPPGNGSGCKASNSNGCGVTGSGSLRAWRHWNFPPTTRGPPSARPAGATRLFDLPPETGEALLEFCRREAVTPFMVLLAAFEVLLQRYSGQDDITVGSPVANRARPETEALIGYFVNVVVLRSDLSGDPSFRELLRRVRQTTLDAYDHQEMTLDQVVAAVNPPRDMSRHPLFQVMFALQNIELPQLDAFGLSMAPLEDGPTARSSYFDLTLAFWQSRPGVPGTPVFRGELNFSTDLFDAETIDRMARHYAALLAAAIAGPDRPTVHTCRFWPRMNGNESWSGGTRRRWTILAMRACTS